MKNVIEFFKIEIDSKRVFGLDLLRTFAIMFVVLSHGQFFLPNSISRFFDFLIFDGVTIFFVLSGFLIGTKLFELLELKGNNLKSILNFWIMRWFRTLPNYFLILILLFFIHLLFDLNFNIKSVIKYFFFSQNLYYDHPAKFFPEAWSLSIEEWFYILLPISFLFLNKLINTNKKTTLYFLIFLILIITLFRYYRYSEITISNKFEWDLSFRKQVITRIDSLIFGVIGAYFNIHWKNVWIKFKYYFFFLGVFLFFATKFILPIIFEVQSLYNCVLSFTFVSIATLLILPYFSNLIYNQGFVYKAITIISLISYSMYLINLSLIQEWIINKLPWNDYIDNNNIIILSKYVTFWFLTFIISILIYKYFERPILLIRDKMKIK